MGLKTWIFGEKLKAADLNANFAAVGVKEFVLKKDLTAGDLVRIIDDGGVSKITDIFEDLSSNVDAGALIAGGNVLADLDSCYDPINNKVVVAYRTNSNYTSFVAGTPFNGGIIWGSAVGNISNNGVGVSIKYDSINKVTIASYGGYTDMKLRSMTVSPTNVITLGTEVSFGAFQTQHSGLNILEYQAGKVLVICAGNYIKAATVSISGITLVVGTVYSRTNSVAVTGYDLGRVRVLFIPATGKIYIIGTQAASFSFTNVIQSASISGDVITFKNNELTYSGTNTTNCRIIVGAVLLSSGKICLFVKNQATPMVLSHIYVTDTDDVLSFSGSLVADNNDVSGGVGVFGDGENVILCYRNTAGNSYLVPGTVSDSDVVWGDPLLVSATGFLRYPLYVPNLGSYALYNLATGYAYAVRLAGRYPTKMSDISGILQSSGVAGGVGSIAMENDLSNVHSGHIINAPAYIDPGTGLVTESASPYRIGTFISPTGLIFSKQQIFVEIEPVMTSLPTANIWTDWVLSFLPAGVKEVEIVVLTSGSATTVGVRANGSLQARTCSAVPSGSTSFRAKPVNNIIELFTSSATTSAYFFITGYWI